MVYKRPGQLCDFEHKCEGSTVKYLKVHSKNLKLYVGQIAQELFIVKKCLIHKFCLFNFV